MSAHYKAFIVVFVVSLLALIFLRRPFVDTIGDKRFKTWRNLWLVYLVLAFFITNYWLFVVVSLFILIGMTRSEPVKPAMFLLMFAAVPAMGAQLQGFAGINRVIEITPQLIMIMVFLAPILFSSRHMKKATPAGGAIDMVFLMWVILQVALATRAETFTHMIRTALEVFLASAPMYYVFSRYPKSLDDVRVITAAFVLPVLVLCVVSIPEFLRSWKLYESVSTNWFGFIPFSYTVRGGFLRTAASVFNPITWGLVIMTAIGVSIALFNDRFSKFYRNIAFAILTFGIYASLSRGPWIGAVAIILVATATSKKAFTRLTQLSVVGGVSFLAALATPFGQKIIGLLPFIGDTADDTVNYRQRLLDTAWSVILENPVFGSGDFWGHPDMQALRQGQGIIDIVNTYLLVGLGSGLTGLGLFVSMFALVIWSLRNAMKSARRYDAKIEMYCQAYMATLIGIAIAIFTTSSVGQIQYIIWSFLGIGVALVRVESIARKKFEEGQAQKKL